MFVDLGEVEQSKGDHEENKSAANLKVAQDVGDCDETTDADGDLDNDHGDHKLSKLQFLREAINKKHPQANISENITRSSVEVEDPRLRFV